MESQLVGVMLQEEINSSSSMNRIDWLSMVLRLRQHNIGYKDMNRTLTSSVSQWISFSGPARLATANITLQLNRQLELANQ